MERTHYTYLSYKSPLLWAEVEQEDQQEAVASLTVVRKEKKVTCMTRACYQSTCLMNSTFSAGQKNASRNIWRFFKKALCYITAQNHAKMLQFCLPLLIHLPEWSSLLLPHHHIEPDWVILLLNASVFDQGSHKARSNQPTKRFTERNAMKSRDLTHSGLDYQSINIPTVKWGKVYTPEKTGS